MHRRAHKRGTRLNLLVCGANGSGKSTLINALCGGKEVASTTDWMDAPPHTAATPRKLGLKTYTEDLQDPEIAPLTLRIIEANGLNESLNNTDVIKDLQRYLEGQFDEVLAEESRIKRNPRFTDNRVHCVLYLIEATGHGLRETDVLLMQHLSTIANIIPCISKSDTLTKAELIANKRLIKEDIEHYEIPVFQFVSQEQLEQAEQAEIDDDQITELRILQDSLPFAIIASQEQIELSGDNVALVRKYPWGMLHIEDPKISDFAMLKQVLFQSHTQELREYTLDFLYEHYRTLRLSSQPDFNAAKAAAAAPMTASRYNLANLSNDMMSTNTSQSSLIPPLQPKPAAATQQRAPQQSNHQVSPLPEFQANPQYVERENMLRAEEELMQQDELRVQKEIEERKQELKRREQELKKLEERLRQAA